MTSLTLQHAQKIRLARDDLERMVHHLPDQVFDDVVKGCTVKVLLEEENQARVYRIAWIAGVDQAAAPYKFGATLTIAKTLLLDFSIFKMSYQMNTISNSEFTDEEFRQWVQTCGQVLPLDVSTADSKAADLARVFEEYPDASTRTSRPRRAGAPQQQQQRLPAPVPPATARRPDGHLSTACNELLDGFIRQKPWLSTDQQDLVKSFAHHMEEYVAKERQRMLHAVRRAEEAQRRGEESGTSLPVTAAGPAGARRLQQRPTPEGTESEYVRLACNLEIMSVEELRKVIAQLEGQRKLIIDKIDEKSKCIICLEHDARVVLLPCKHQVLCSACSAQFQACPMCRAEIKDRFEPFGG